MPTSETNHNIKTLNELEQLKRCGFGKPPPRHGLNLLHWFATEYVFVPHYNPQNGEFGFHLFENKPADDGYRLLPESYQPYYIVGNLNRPGADSLPDYFDDYYTGELDDSNTDRIIVSLNFDRIYVTEHIDQWNFNPRATYRISKGLLNTISRMIRNDFLSEMGYDEQPTVPLNYNSSQSIVLDMPAEQEQASQKPPVEPPRSRGFWNNCTIL